MAGHIGDPELQPLMQQISNHYECATEALWVTKSESHHSLPAFVFAPSPEPSVRDTAPLVALLDALDERSWNVGLESLEVVWCDLLGEAQCS